MCKLSPRHSVILGYPDALLYTSRASSFDAHLHMFALPTVMKNLLTHPQAYPAGLFSCASTCTAIGGKVTLHQCLDVDCEQWHSEQQWSNILVSHKVPVREGVADLHRPGNTLGWEGVSDITLHVQHDPSTPLDHSVWLRLQLTGVLNCH